MYHFLATSMDVLILSPVIILHIILALINSCITYEESSFKGFSKTKNPKKYKSHP